MRMCDCVPNHIKYSFRCKRRRNLSFLGLRLNCTLEFTIIHFWLYMVFLGVVIAFVLKSVGCYLQHRNAKTNGGVVAVPSEGNRVKISENVENFEVNESSQDNQHFTGFPSTYSILKPSKSAISLDG